MDKSVSNIMSIVRELTSLRPSRTVYLDKIEEMANKTRALQIKVRGMRMLEEDDLIECGGASCGTAEKA